MEVTMLNAIGISALIILWNLTSSPPVDMGDGEVGICVIVAAITMAWAVTEPMISDDAY